MTDNKWLGVYFDTVPLYGYTIDSVLVKFKVGYLSLPTEGGKFFVDVSNNKAATNWSDDRLANESGYDVNNSTHTVLRNQQGRWLWYEYDVTSIISDRTQLNNMEVLFRNYEPSGQNLYIDRIIVEVTYHETIEIINAETIDDDNDGKIDAYHIFFSTPINDSTLNAIANGFDVAGYSDEAFSSIGLTNHPDTADDADIYISFTEGGSADTANLPDLTFSQAFGTLQSLTGYPLLDVGTNNVTESDGAAPVIISAQASDDSGGGPGIQAGDKVQLIFSENTNAPVIDASNIDTILALSGGHIWKDGSGNIGSTQWLTSSVLLITLSSTGGSPTIATGDTITSDGTTIIDSSSNPCSNIISLTGDFGSDTLPPYIISRETRDLDYDGYIDAIRIIFNEEISTSTVVASDFDVIGISGESYFEGTSPYNDIYITFNDGILKTNASPSLSYTKGSLTDLSGYYMADSPLTPCSDKAPPAILSAVASDGTILVPGVDSDDTVTIYFSENTNRPTLDEVNIDAVLVLTSPFNESHTWKDATGNWNALGDILIITFGIEASSATVSVEDTITISSTTTPITDGILGNISTDDTVLSGTFVGTDNIPPQIITIFPEDKDVGVSIYSPVRINFSEKMDENNTKNAISITAIRDKDGNNINEIISGNVLYDFTNSQLTFTPASNLKKNYTYQVNITSQATDTIGNPLNEHSFAFITIIDYTQTNTIVSWDEKTKLFLEAQTSNTDCSFNINSSPQYTVVSGIFDANNKLELNADPFSSAIEHTIIEINTFNNNNEIFKNNFNMPLVVTLSYNDNAPEDGIVDETNPPVREETLQMYRLDEESNLWVRLANSAVNSEANTVSAHTIHTSVFSLIGSSYSDISEAYAFPVPFKPSRGDKEIKFVNLSPMATIKIFTLSGELVKKIEHTSGDTILSWDVTNKNGDKLASGVYLYIIENTKQSKKGKLMIIK